MMRSLFTAVSGLKTHQTKMDVIGNNVSNVNTVAFKSSSVTFSEMMYQTLSNASGANGTTGTGGVNAKQIGLGVTSGATNISITTSGAAETTGRPFDIRLTDQNSTNFFIVSNGSENMFTRAGSFYIDGAGNLAMTSTGYTVMGWQVDETSGAIKKDTVSALRIMQEKNLTSNPEATTDSAVTGVLDKNESNVTSDSGYAMSLNFYDTLGYSYAAKFAVKLVDAESLTYTVELSDILDSSNTSVLKKYLDDGGTLAQVFGNNTTSTKKYDIAVDGIKYTATGIGGTAIGADSYYYEYTTYNAAGEAVPGYAAVTLDTAAVPPTYTVAGYSKYNSAAEATQVPTVAQTAVPSETGTIADLFGVTSTQVGYLAGGGTTTATIANGQFSVTEPTVNYTLKFNPDDGTFTYVGADGSDSVKLNLKNTLGNQFSDINVDFSQTKSVDNSGSSSMAIDPGKATDSSLGKGKALGALIGITVDNSGKIYGSYDNGNTELLGQIAVAQFANASGLEKVGENCYKTTLNSGEFDGIGVEISADGSGMTSGELEMSNVDLATEFTQMIITQRGYQANSRVITTSDTLLEELINLKR